MARQASCKKWTTPPPGKKLRERVHSSMHPCSLWTGRPLVGTVQQASALSCPPPRLWLPGPKHPAPPSLCGCSGDNGNKFEPSMGYSACLDVSHNTAQTYLVPPASSGNSFSCFCPAPGPFLRTFPGCGIWVLKSLSRVHLEGGMSGIVQGQGLSKPYFVRSKHLFWGLKNSRLYFSGKPR